MGHSKAFYRTRFIRNLEKAMPAEKLVYWAATFTSGMDFNHHCFDNIWKYRLTMNNGADVWNADVGIEVKYRCGSNPIRSDNYYEEVGCHLEPYSTRICVYYGPDTGTLQDDCTQHNTKLIWLKGSLEDTIFSLIYQFYSYFSQTRYDDFLIMILNNSTYSSYPSPSPKRTSDKPSFPQYTTSVFSDSNPISENSTFDYSFSCDVVSITDRPPDINLSNQPLLPSCLSLNFGVGDCR